MSLRAELVCDVKAELAEGPVWHDGALWWVNINVGTLNRLDVRTGLITTRATGDFLGAAVPDDQDGWLLARRNLIARLDWKSGNITALAELPDLLPRLRFNDGKCDPRGRFFCGTMHRDDAPERAAFYRFAGGTLEKQFDGARW
jgi:sugar lactone lactonase YvrE